MHKEFQYLPQDSTGMRLIEDVRVGFDAVLGHIEAIVNNRHGREMAIVRTKLEEACFYAVKAICLEHRSDQPPASEYPVLAASPEPRWHETAPRWS